MSEATTEELLIRVLERMERLEARLDGVHRAVQLLETVSEKAPVMIEAVATTSTWAWDQAEAAGIDPIAAGQRAAGIALQAGKPDSLATVERLLAKQATLHKTLDAVEKLEADGTLDALVAHGTALAPKLAKLVQSPSYTRLMDHALGDAAALDVADAATTAMIETRQAGFKPLGVFGQLGMLMDADVQKALGFGLAIAKRLGQKL